jgi:hypothetical protein
MLLALVAVFALVAAGCGGDDDDTSSTDDTASDDTSEDTSEDTGDDLSDEEVLEELCAIDAELEDLDDDLSEAGQAEDVDAFRDAVDRGIELTREASDLPLDQLEPGLEDALADQLELLDGLAADLEDVEDFDELVEVVNALEDEDGDPLEEFTDEECGGSDDSTPVTEDTTPDTVVSSGIAAEIVAEILGETQFAGGSEETCIVEGLEASFDDDELEELRAADSFTEDQAAALSDVFEPCLPYQDLIASGVEGQLGDEDIEACVIGAYEGYDWQGVFADTDGERALLDETVQFCTDDASGNSGAPTPNPPGTVVDLFDANIGDCFLDADRTPADYTVVDCAEPHDQEVFAIFDLPDGAFPGEDVVREDAQVGCIAEFEAYVGRSYDESALYADQPIVPSAGSWDGGDREVICLLYSRDGLVEGSGYQSGI